ncbi:terminase large subunit [Enterococcus casseliflavus]|uniref:terminase large subunit n=1 Tax=Enterococcus TaxID=1350 RepID=UPI001CBF6AC1|nr:MULTISPECIES: terminase TerL endonuclease subunit [Enterococcus]MBZ3642433.1 terminase large subunit [Enterococcus casseliflavus]MCD5185865.1 terminase large subunit [Enterococcus gallinarum]
MHDYVADYINAVESNEIVVGKKIQQAIDRHLRDLEKSKSDEYPYEFDLEKSRLPLQFISSLPDPKSMKVNEMALFQKFIIQLIFGWVHKDTGYRRFRKAYISLSRKQGKSLLVSGIALYLLLYERSPRESRQIYTTANKRDQAKIVFNMTKKQLKAIRAQSKAIKKFTKILQTEIKTDDDSFISPLSSDADTLDGLDTLLGVFDEYALSRTTEMMDVIESSMGQQDSPLILIISTASSKLTYPMYQVEYPYVAKILNEEVEDEEYLALCWEQDSPSEVEDEKLWIKSNPLLEVGGEVAKRNIAQIKKLYKEGLAKGTVSNVLTKHFNLWVQATKESYFTADEWNSASTETKYNIKGRKAYVGLDVSRSGDLTSVSWVIPIEEEQKFFVDSYSFVATKGGIDVKEREDNTPYRELERKGYCSITTLESGLIDYDDMCDWLINFVNENELDVQAVAYDPAYANVVVSKLDDVLPLIQVRQTKFVLTAPIRQFKYDALNDKVRHNSNPLLDRAIYNAITIEDNDLVQIDKTTNRNKIDPLMALIDSYSEAMYHDLDIQDINKEIAEHGYSFGY